MTSKTYLLVLLAISLVSFGFSAFVHKKLNPVTFYYKINIANQRIEPNITTPGVEHSITATTFCNPNNWTVIDQGADTYSGNDASSYIKSFTIEDYESVCDGDDDGQICLTEALNALCNLLFVSGGTYPSTCGSITVDANNSGGAVLIYDFTRAESANIP